MTASGLQDEARPRLELLSRGTRSGAKHPPLLFVHGAWHGAWCWDCGFLDRIAREGFEVHALSLRGHGGSAGSARLRTTRIRDYVEDVAEVVDGLRAPPIVIGHSMGGFVAQKLMERRPLPGVVLMASVPPDGVRALFGQLIRTDPVAMMQAHLQVALKPVVSTPERVRRLFFSEAISDTAVEAVAARMGNEAFYAYLDMMFTDLCKPASGTPVLVLGAENDALFPPKVTRQIADTYGTTAILFPDMGHDMMLDVGWERVADAIMDWTAGAPAVPFAEGTARAA